MIYTFINDLHIYAPNELEGYRNCFNPSDENEFFLGDNFDLINCKKKEVKNVQREIDKLKEKYGKKFITGNHEAQRDTDSLVIVKPGIAAMHGDDIFWGREKSVKYRQKDRGAGFLKRGLWVNALEAFEQGYDRKVSDEDLKRFDSVATANGVHTIIVGHLHPKDQLNINYNNKRLVVLKRGITTLLL